MEYTKDLILNVNYGQDSSKPGIFKSVITKHKIMMIVILISLILMTLDIILVSSFVRILSTL